MFNATACLCSSCVGADPARIELRAAARERVLRRLELLASNDEAPDNDVDVSELLAAG